MSTLTELVDIAVETKENSKNALIEKGLELDDSYKLSDVDERIAEIVAGSINTNRDTTYDNREVHYIDVNAFPFEIDDETIKNLKFTDISADGKQTTDISKEKDGSIVTWIDGDTRYISTQDTTRSIGFEKLGNKDYDSDAGTIVYSLFASFEVNSNYYEDETGDGWTEYYWEQTFTPPYETIEFKNVETKRNTNMCGMFGWCKKTKKIDVKSLNTSNVKDISAMFFFCEALTEIDVSGFDTSKVTAMDSMFTSCRSLTQLDLSNFNTTKVTTMYSMFVNCFALKTLDLSNFDLSSVKDISNMFYFSDTDNPEDSQLETIYAQEWVNLPHEKLTYYLNMFYYASSLPNYQSENYGIEMAKWKENGGYFTNPADKGKVPVGKAIVILTPCGQGPDEITLINDPCLCRSSNWSIPLNEEITYTAQVYVQKQRDSKYYQGNINVYELEPSETEYYVYGCYNDHGHDGSSELLSEDIYKFNEAKVYFLDTSKITFWDTF